MALFDALSALLSEIAALGGGGTSGKALGKLGEAFRMHVEFGQQRLGLFARLLRRRRIGHDPHRRQNSARQWLER